MGYSATGELQHHDGLHLHEDGSDLRLVSASACKLFGLAVRVLKYELLTSDS